MRVASVCQQAWFFCLLQSMTFTSIYAQTAFCGAVGTRTTQCNWNGLCVSDGGSDGVCSCDSNTTGTLLVYRHLGTRCEYACPLASASGLPCDGRTTCNLNGGGTAAECTNCPQGYEGAACDSLKDCPFVNAQRCYGHGTCLQGYCDCEDDYADADCSRYTTPRQFHNENLATAAPPSIS